MTENHLAVIVLAAGEGTRMKSSKPKVMHEIAGLPMIGHVLATASALDAAHVLSVIRHERELIGDYIGSHFANTTCVEQDDQPGTGRAVECAMDALPNDFNGAVVVTSGDVPLLEVSTLEALIDAHVDGGFAVSVLSSIAEDPTGYGRIVRTSDDEFQAIVEHKDATEAQLEIAEVNAGIYVFDSAVLRKTLPEIDASNAQGEKYLTDVVSEALKHGHKVQALAVEDNGQVAGINDRVQLAEVSAELNWRICEAWMKAGVTIIDPASTWIDVTATLGQDVTLLPSTMLKGLTSVGEGATVGPEVVLVDSQVGARASVSKSQVNSSVIGDGASVGPFAYLRPGTELGVDAKIGTFVETKNAKIGAGSKVPHLTYVGDAEIGVETNIGAGTIFANYDGVNKHRSTIGSHVRTGAHNVFVAPVTISDGAYTAAGTVVRRDVEPGALAMNVTPQRNLADWVLDKRPGSQAASAAESAKSNK
jgi:bifunctional UDP-N-acetylglucosamine pyrophosphorylase/glucosamine-1-phosphate N-acetyltransferase